MDARLVETAKIDLSDKATFARSFPHDHFTWAREHTPVYCHEPTAVTRRQSVRPQATEVIVHAAAR